MTTFIAGNKITKVKLFSSAFFVTTPADNTQKMMATKSPFNSHFSKHWNNVMRHCHSITVKKIVVKRTIKMRSPWSFRKQWQNGKNIKSQLDKRMCRSTESKHSPSFCQSFSIRFFLLSGSDRRQLSFDYFDSFFFFPSLNWFPLSVQSRWLHCARLNALNRLLPRGC